MQRAFSLAERLALHLTSRHLALPALRSPRLVLLLVLLVLPVVVLASSTPIPAQAASSTIVISQIYGGGGNVGATLQNDFIELFNRGTVSVDITGWSVQYASSSGSSWQVTPLSGSMAPGTYYLVQEAAGSGGTVNLPPADAIGTIAMSATDGKVALVGSTAPLTGTCPTGGAIVDFVGFGSANCYEGAGATGTLGNTTAAIRNGGGATDTDNNKADFSVGAPNPRNNSNNPYGIGLAIPSGVLRGGTTLLTVAVTAGANPTSSGLRVTCDLNALGGSASQPFFDDGSHGDATAADNTFSYSISVPSGATGGIKNISCTVADAQNRSTPVALVVYVVIPIGAVNGPVANADNGTTHQSPYKGQSVAVQGVIYEKTLQATSNPSNTYKGFYIQNTSATTDGNPNTSDGLFVYMGTSSTMSGPSGAYTPAVGDEIVLAGSVGEYYNMTELQSPMLLALVRNGVNVNAEVPPVAANPPADLADANRYWERLQGMRVQVPANSIVLGGRNVFNPADAEVWVANPDSTVAKRADPYTRRAFRDAHPLDDNYDPNNWDGNGYRILMGSLGIKAAANDAKALIAPARTFATLNGAVAGGLNYTYSKYRIEVEAQPAFSNGVDPAGNNPPPTFDRKASFSVVDYNLENLYDYRNNPASGCDFAGDTGCSNTGTPFLAPIKPPYDYVPVSEAAYQARLTDIAKQIINDLHSPDILMLQEVENQDICTVSGGALSCGTTNNADGKPDVLQDLALKIASLGGPAYDSAFDRNSSDLRGILPAFMYRTDRVQLLPAAGDPILGAAPAIVYAGAPVPYDGDVSNPKSLNAVLPAGISACESNWVFPRAPDIGLFRIRESALGEDNHVDVYVINNHFKSGPDSCVAHRAEQAKYSAAIVKFIQTAKPGARIVLGGDLNVYPRPDDPFAPIGQANSSDQLAALYDPALGLKNLWEVLKDQKPEAAYSYVYNGMAQTLDQLFVNHAALAGLRNFRIAHINSDFPADYTGDVGRGTSDHDPQAAYLCTDGTAPAAVATPNKLWPPEHQYVTVTVRGTDNADPNPTVKILSVKSTEADNGLGDGDQPNDIGPINNNTVKLRAERSGTGPGRTYTIQYEATDACGNVGTGSVTVTVPHDIGTN